MFNNLNINKIKSMTNEFRKESEIIVVEFFLFCNLYYRYFSMENIRLVIDAGLYLYTEILWKRKVQSIVE